MLNNVVMYIQKKGVLREGFFFAQEFFQPQIMAFGENNASASECFSGGTCSNGRHLQENSKCHRLTELRTLLHGISSQNLLDCFENRV